MGGFVDGYWWSNDGLRLHYRDYAGDPARPPILCLPGLTRNARDFATLAERLSPAWRVIAVDLRGRGDSAYARDSMSYGPLTYVQDIERLLTELGIDRFVSIGTSLGGLVTMLLASTAGKRIEAAVLNDIGPDVEPAGLTRIQSYVGRGGSWPTWMHAARAVAEVNAGVYPGYAIEDWLAMAKRMYRVGASGRVVLDYDMRIAEPMRLAGGGGGLDLWRALDGLKGTPTLILRGALTDVLGEETLARMLAQLPQATAVTVPRVGHAPTLDEPAAVAAIDALLDRVV